VVGEVDQLRRLGVGLSWCELAEEAVRPGRVVVLKVFGQQTRPALLSQETAIHLAGLFSGLLAASAQSPDAKVGTLRPVPVRLGVRRGRERSASVDGLFEGLVGDWRKANP
jgi:hypothetical protein